MQPWWRGAVVYQVYPASFMDSNGDGFGDLGGVLARLDYLSWLGVDALWLSPVYPTPWVDGGYDVSDYCAIDPRFGDLTQFDALLAAVHARQMRLVLDLVPSHTSDQHEWFRQSRAARDSPKRDWYWWRPPRPGFAPGEPGAEPTNWRSEFGTSAWQFDEPTGEYYLHLYAGGQPDLNWENADVRQAMYAVMRWWLDRGVDGFRMDVINKISKDPALPDVALAPGERYGRARQHYVNGPRLHTFLQEMNREALAPYGGRLLAVGETSGATVADARLLTDPARRELDMVFTFEHVRVDQGASPFEVKPLNLPALKDVMARWQVGLAKVGWNSLYWCNHDQPRVVSRWGHDGRYRVQSATMLATILHLHRGTPYVYQGEELGMTNSLFAGIDDVVDVQARSFYAAAVAAGEHPDAVLAGLRMMSRDNARTPMQWDATPGAGFTTGTPWQPINANYTDINVAAATADPTSVLHHYRSLIALRHRDPVVVDGDFTMLLATHPFVYAYIRSLDGQRLLVLGHFGDDEVEVTLPDAAIWSAAEVVLGNYPAPVGLRLRPWEAVVRRLPAPTARAGARRRRRAVGPPNAWPPDREPAASARAEAGERVNGAYRGDLHEGDENADERLRAERPPHHDREV